MTSGLIHALWRDLPKLITAAILGVVAGLWVAHSQPTTSTATSDVFVKVGFGSTATELNRGRVAAQRATASLGELAVSESVLSPVIKDLGLADSPKALAKRIETVASADGQLASISVTDPDPRQADRIATAVASSTAQRFAELAPRSRSGAPALTAVELGTSVDKPYRPSPLGPAALGAVVVTMLAVVHTSLRHLGDERIRRVDDISAMTSAPVLGTITPRYRRRREETDDGLLGPIVLGWLQQDPGSTVFFADTRDDFASLETAQWLQSWSTRQNAPLDISIEQEPSPEFDTSPLRAMVIATPQPSDLTDSGWTTVLTVRRHHTQLADLERAITFLQLRGFGVLGIVIVNRHRRFLLDSRKQVSTHS